MTTWKLSYSVPKRQAVKRFLCLPSTSSRRRPPLTLHTAIRALSTLWQACIPKKYALTGANSWSPSVLCSPPVGRGGGGSIGEVGLDFYWTREFEQEQLEAFEEQVRWSVETRLPLMIHCRKAQNEMVNILKRYAHDLPGGVFHCFTGNEIEARQLLAFDNFVLGIGGVFTFKKSNLPETLRSLLASDPSLLTRIVLETDAPYMAPVPKRGQRNEPAFIRYVITRMSEALGVSEEEICKVTNDNVARVFGLK